MAPQIEALYGGAAGGGKSEALLMGALQYADVPGYAALLLRRSYTDLAMPGALMDRALGWLGGVGHWDQAKHRWRLPSGAVLQFGYLERLSDRFRYQSSEFQYIGFDELTQFGEGEYLYLFSRLRRLAGSMVPVRMRAATNPGGVGHDWVRARFLVGGDGRCFVRARLSDNPFLDQAGYRESLARLSGVERAQLLDGDWDVRCDSLISWDDFERCVDASALWGDAARGRSGCAGWGVGVDVGRTHDRTVVSVVERVGDVFWVREQLVLHRAAFAEQRAAILGRCGRGCLVCAIDRGGIGMQLAEELEARLPGVAVGVAMAGGVAGRLAVRLRTAFVERRVRVPDDPELRRDVVSVPPLRSVGGVDYVSSPRGETGHCDRFWALALAVDGLAGRVAWSGGAALPRGVPGRAGVVRGR